MDDFTLLMALQNELIRTLQKRKDSVGGWVERDFSKAKIRRLRLQIQEIMMRIEDSCISYYEVIKEGWYK